MDNHTLYIFETFRYLSSPYITNGILELSIAACAPDVEDEGKHEARGDRQQTDKHCVSSKKTLNNNIFGMAPKKRLNIYC